MLGFVFLLVVSCVSAAVEERVTAVHASEALSAIENRVSYGISRGHMPMDEQFGFEKGRRLMQGDAAESCRWKGDDTECVISEAAEIEIFGKSKNPNAQYYSDHMLCDNFIDETSCYESGCHWVNGQFCEFGVARHEIVSCFRNATYFLHRTHHASVCSQLSTAAACENNLQCNWGSGSYCDLDVFYALTGVPSKGGSPEGYEEVLNLMWAAATVAFSEDFPTHRALISSTDAVVNWTPPPFVCPERFDPLACDYAEPVAKILPISVYCDVAYGRDWDSCEADALCTVMEGRIRRCAVSDEEISRRHHEAIDVYVNAIHDSYLREIYAQVVACSMQETLTECEAESCVWYENTGCTVSTAQIREAYLRELDDETHPVCHMFVISAEAECGDIINSDTCQSDEKCVWDYYDNSCYTSEQAIIDYLLDNDRNLKKAFNRVAKRCSKQKTKRACLQA